MGVAAFIAGDAAMIEVAPFTFGTVKPDRCANDFPMAANINAVGCTSATATR
jgi:hypothetical protein